MRRITAAFSSCLALLAACAASAPTPTAQAPAQVQLASPPSIDCALTGSSTGVYEGGCTVSCTVDALGVNFDGVDAKRACSGLPRIVAISLARTSAPGRWLGTMEGVRAEDPTRVEVVPAKTGAAPSVARTPYGWFAVRSLDASATGLRLRVDASRQVRPDADDLAIIDRAIALIPNREAWNKNDNRECPPAQPRLSLFCALLQATTEVSGGVHYRQPAMQAVREELNAVDPARIKTHRIMDYNNHPDTTLDEVHALLKRARLRVEREIR